MRPGRCVKVRYKSEAAAVAAANVSARAARVLRNVDEAPLRAYKCPICFRWHLTSQRRRAS